MPQPPAPPSQMGDRGTEPGFLTDIRLLCYQLVVENLLDGILTILTCCSGRFEEIAREELLGKGSFGTVYRAVWRPPNQPARSEQ